MSVPRLDQTNIQAKPNYPGIYSLLFKICHDKTRIYFANNTTGEHTPIRDLTSVSMSTSWYGRLSAKKKLNTWLSNGNHDKRKKLLLKLLII
jgi:hypothetical protein